MRHRDLDGFAAGADVVYRLLESQQKALERSSKWEPKTREAAKVKWKKLQNSPDHLSLLEMYRKEGLEVLKLAKYVHSPQIISWGELLLTENQRTRHHPPHRQTPPRPRNPIIPHRPPHPHQRPSRPSPTPPPHSRIRRPRLRPPTPHLLNPQPPPLRRLRRARSLLHGSLRAGSHPAPAHNRTLDRPPRQLHLQEIAGKF